MVIDLHSGKITSLKIVEISIDPSTISYKTKIHRIRRNSCYFSLYYRIDKIPTKYANEKEHEKAFKR